MGAAALNKSAAASPARIADRRRRVVGCSRTPGAARRKTSKHLKQKRGAPCVFVARTRTRSMAQYMAQHGMAWHGMAWHSIA